MRKLAARLGELAKHVPTEFVNSQDLETEAQQDALARLRESVERGDLEQADRVLHELERQIDAMANALGSGVESFEATRLGARERAMAEAMSELADLELEQKDLAHRTNDSRKEATTRAIGDLRGNTPALDALAERARQARESLERVRPRELDADSKGMYELADRRLQDVATLLEAGDLGEAQKMSGEASDAVSDLARDLGLASLMFGGRGGESTDRAVRARAAETDARALEDAIDRAIPSMDNYVSEAANRQMHGDSPRQDAAREAAHRLAERFRQGPDGLPLDPDAADAVDRAKDRMADARGALAGGDVVGASRAQTDAAEELADLRRRLEQSSSKDSSGGDSGETDPRQPVEIPRETADARASDLRRKLLDGLRETAPRGYEEAVRKYYQELLR
ncbi:MAG: hypothetical protein KC417_12055, partial [Myxococcales bacterium]|nr:hypothetical protein [Myxococcales bacterium]